MSGKTQICLVKERLFPLVEHVKISDRNRNIIMECAEGKSYTELGEKYGISGERVRAIVVQYITHCHWFIAKLPGNFERGQVSDVDISTLQNANIVICDDNCLGFLIDKLSGQIIQFKKLGKVVWENYTQECENI